MNSVNGPLGGVPGLRPLQQVSREKNGTLESLATGLRINRAADDPAGLISSEALRAMLAELEAESRAMDRTTQISAVADASLGAIGDLLIEAEAVAVANANAGGLSDAEREANQMELSSLLQSVDRLAQQSSFADRPLLRGSMTLNAAGASVTLPSAAVTDLGQTEANGETYSLADVDRGGTLDTTAGTSETAIEVIRAAREEILRARASLGAFVADTVEPMQRDIAIAIENTAAAESSIRDADYAKETADLIRLNALESASLTAVTVGPFDPTRLIALLG